MFGNEWLDWLIKKIYTTSIMTTKEKGDIIRYIKSKRSESVLPERKTKMTTMNRFYSLYSDRLESALESKLEWGFSLMRSDKAKQKREIVLKD